MKTALDYFGELLVRRVRDETIDDWEMILDGRTKDEGSQHIRLALQRGALDRDMSQVLSWLVPKIVDTTIHHLLWTLEQEASVNVTVDTGTENVLHLREASDGLAGELYEWITRFSKKPYEEP